MTAKLTLGPVLFNWSPEYLRDFYYRIADEAPVDSVYLGEVVCAKRAPFFEPHLHEVAGRLRRAGKEVVLSTLALVMNEQDSAAVRRVANEQASWLVEANDISCVNLIEGRPHVIGPFVNVYNERTLRYLVERGAVRVSLPAELPASSLAVLAGSAEVELEVQVFGRLPLAISARCYHARSHGLTKDGCRFVCAEDTDGMEVFTLDGEPFLAVNGTQTMSSTYCNLLAQLDALRDAGIGAFRLWPHRLDMVRVATIFREVLDRRVAIDQAMAALTELTAGARFSNGFYFAKEGLTLVSEADR